MVAVYDLETCYIKKGLGEGLLRGNHGDSN